MAEERLNKTSYATYIRESEDVLQTRESFLFMDYHVNSNIVSVGAPFMESGFSPPDLLQKFKNLRQEVNSQHLAICEPRVELQLKEVVALPKEVRTSPKSFEDLVWNRRSLREAVDYQLTLEQLSYLLYNCMGITAQTVHTDPMEGNVKITFRAVPSGGGLYPIEMYLIPKNVEGLELDMYHYDPYKHEVGLLGKKVTLQLIDRFFLEASVIAKASLIIILTAKFRRSSIKYGERAYRFVLMEAGAILQNFCLSAETLGLRGVFVGGYTDVNLNEFIGCNGADEAVIVCGAVGMSEHDEFKSNVR
jgi:SagB-type dehydrogenase family enzyme